MTPSNHPVFAFVKCVADGREWSKAGFGQVCTPFMAFIREGIPLPFYIISLECPPFCDHVTPFCLVVVWVHPGLAQKDRRRATVLARIFCGTPKRRRPTRADQRPKPT